MELQRWKMEIKCAKAKINKWAPYYVLILRIFQKMGTKMAVEATLLTEEKECAPFHVTQHTAAMMSMDPGI